MPSEQESYNRYQKALARSLAMRQASTERRGQTALVSKKGGIDAARDAQEQAAQAKRDKMQHLYEQQITAQRAGIDANAMYQQHGYTSQRDKQQQIDQLKRDALQHGYTLQRDDRQFGQETQRDKQQHGQQLQRDAIQQGYTTDRDRQQFGYDTLREDQQFGQQVQRDVMQDTFTNRRDRNQQKNLLERDRSQFGYDSLREQQQQGYQAQRDERLQGYDVQNDERQFGQQQLRDERQQGYTQQNATQRETFDVAAKWQENIQQARNSGMDFSADQKKEIQTLNRQLTKIVNDPNLGEGEKQTAGLIIQRKLAAFVPDEPVRHPQDALQQSLLFDERVPGVPFMMGYDSQGRPTFDPLGSSGGPKQEDPATLAKEQRDMALKRELSLQKHRKAIESAVDPKADPETGDPRLFKTEPEIDAELRRRFAAEEEYYTRGGEPGGLPPHEMYQMEARRQQQQGQERQQRLRELPSQYDRKPQPQGQPPVQGGQQPPVTQKPVTVSSSNLSQHLQNAVESGDPQVAAAWEGIDTIIKQYGGPPPEGTQADAEFAEALLFLQSRGISVSGDKPKKPSRPLGSDDYRGRW